MSSINRCTAGFLMSARSMARALARKTGWPMRATFRIDITDELYWVRAYRVCAAARAAPARRLARLSFLSTVRRAARAQAAESIRAGAARLQCVRLRLLHRSQDRRRHDHPQRVGQHRARASRD